METESGEPQSRVGAEPGRESGGEGEGKTVRRGGEPGWSLKAEISVGGRKWGRRVGWRTAREGWRWQELNKRRSLIEWMTERLRGVKMAK